MSILEQHIEESDDPKTLWVPWIRHKRDPMVRISYREKLNKIFESYVLNFGSKNKICTKTSNLSLISNVWTNDLHSKTNFLNVQMLWGFGANRTIVKVDFLEK